ncbi:hypothetical protein MPSEU_000885900 [Mayamaea pseudoterrestris]|nr:hypothetical protein MPSEU_000885900 [Mayamaea pseudoterrestris]
MQFLQCCRGTSLCHSLAFFVLILGSLQLIAILTQVYGTNARDLLCQSMNVQRKTIASNEIKEKASETTAITELEQLLPRRYPVSDSNATTNFEGVQARAFTPYEHPVPCFEPEQDWKLRQSDASQTGFLFVKPFKTGSSTASGLNLRIARNVAARDQQHDFDVCKARSDHVWANAKYYDRLPDKSFLWTIVRHPTARVVSQFFHFRVSRAKSEPTDRNFIAYMTTGPIDMIHDYYLGSLSLQDYKRGETDPVATANHILKEYNFVGITERMDESAIALAMLLNVPIGDLLYLTAKGHGGYDDAGGRDGNVCTFIWPSFVSSGMQAYLDSDDWKEKSHWDTILYDAANRSLDLTIDKLGRERFYDNVAVYKQAKRLSEERCLHNVTFPCSEGGDYTPDEETSCLWKDSGWLLARHSCLRIAAQSLHKGPTHFLPLHTGCGCECLDAVARELKIDQITL